MIDSELLAHLDEFYTDQEKAISAFNQINQICSATAGA
jgi:hypothetical protein